MRAVTHQNGENRVVRGGSWNDRALYCRAALRYGYSPGHRDGDVGFRLSRGQG